MAGFFVVVLFIIGLHSWYASAALVGLWLLWYFVLEPWWRGEVEQAREHQHHRRARAEIDAVTRETRQAMIDAAREGWR
jgi:fatty acid desaturase